MWPHRREANQTHATHRGSEGPVHIVRDVKSTVSPIEQSITRDIARFDFAVACYASRPSSDRRSKRKRLI